MKVELYQTASILSIFAILYEKISIPINGYPFLIYLAVLYFFKVYLILHNV